MTAPRAPDPGVAALPPVPARATTWLADPLASLTTVTVMCRLPPLSEGNHAAMEVLGAVLDQGLDRSLARSGAAWTPPHVHCVVTAGGLADDGSWVHTPPHFPIAAMRKVFHGVVRKHLFAAHASRIRPFADEVPKSFRVVIVGE